jgi:hypothetical protein
VTTLSFVDHGGPEMQWHRVLPFLLFAAACGTWSAPARASVRAGTYEYAISHDVLGRIGTHTATFERQGDDLIVSLRIQLAVKIGGLTLYTFESTGSEVWRDGRLIAASADTNDNGRLKRVTAQSSGDRLVVEGPRGRVEADQPVGTVNFWNFDSLAAPVLVEPTSGRVYRVEINPAQRESIRTMDRLVATQKYEVKGEIEGELWYADDGTWVRMDFVRHGSTLSVTLESIRG